MHVFANLFRTFLITLFCFSVLILLSNTKVLACSGVSTEQASCSAMTCSAGAHPELNGQPPPNGSQYYQTLVSYRSGGPNGPVDCQQMEYFDNSSCTGDPVSGLGCVGGCTSSAQCGGGLNVCAGPDEVNSISSPACGNPNWESSKPNKYCQVAVCGFDCTANVGCVERTRGFYPGPPQYQGYGQCSTSCHICNPNEFDSNRCAFCNSAGSAYETNGCGNWGTVNGTGKYGVTQGQWCGCAQTCDPTEYSKTKYPQCFNSDQVVVCNNNGIKDNGETGIDCGGGACPVCETTNPGTACSGSCGDSNYGGLPNNCNGSWAYAGNSQNDIWCQQQPGGNVKGYCYTCNQAGSTPPSICTNGQTTNVCRPDGCTPGSVGSP